MLDAYGREGRNGEFAALVLTHAHFDHAENAAQIQSNYQVPIIVSKREADFLRRGDNSSICGSVPVTKYAVELLEGRLRSYFRYEPAQPDVLVDHKLELDIIGLPHISIIHTPGHTAGSQSIIVDHEIALVGDAMIGALPQSLFPPFAENSRLLIDSWRTLLETDCRIFFPSHGRESSRARLVREYNKYIRPSILR